LARPVFSTQLVLPAWDSSTSAAADLHQIPLNYNLQLTARTGERLQACKAKGSLAKG
jgi:hypothetical protein